MSDDKVLVLRELLEVIASTCMFTLPEVSYQELRSLLAQPSDGALTNEGAEPDGKVWFDEHGPRAMLLNHSLTEGSLLYSSPPAPASVVLPSLEDFQACVIAKYGFPSYQLCLLDGKDLQNLWVACLDRVKELNS